LPLVPLAMLLTFIAGVGAILLPGAPLLIGFAGYTVLNYMTQVAYFLAGLSWATTEVEFTLFVAVATYSAIAVWMLYMNWRTRIDLREVNIVE
jgi:hypothetical protein